MSHEHQVANLASSFVEMAKAFEELPRIKAELAEANRAFSHASDTIQRLELKLIDRNTTIDELNAKVRETEVARDDAELRFLEADDKLAKVAGALQTAGETVGLALRKPEPVVVAEEPISGQSVTDPTVNLPSGNESPSAASPDAVTSNDAVQQTTAEVPPEPFSPESKPIDPVEVREELPPSPISDGSNTSDLKSIESPESPIGTSTGQRDPLPTVASPIDESTVKNTDASPSGDASSPIDEIDTVSYANEPADKWTQRWREWADKMDRRYGRYNWPIRATA